MLIFVLFLFFPLFSLRFSFSYFLVSSLSVAVDDCKICYPLAVTLPFVFNFHIRPACHRTWLISISKSHRILPGPFPSYLQLRLVAVLEIVSLQSCSRFFFFFFSFRLFFFLFIFSTFSTFFSFFFDSFSLFDSFGTFLGNKTNRGKHRRVCDYVERLFAILLPLFGSNVAKRPLAYSCEFLCFPSLFYLRFVKHESFTSLLSASSDHLIYLPTQSKLHVYL